MSHLTSDVAPRASFQPSELQKGFQLKPLSFPSFSHLSLVCRAIDSKGERVKHSGRPRKAPRNTSGRHERGEEAFNPNKAWESILFFSYSPYYNNIRWHAWHVAKHVSYDERIWGNLASGLEVIRHFDISALLRICLVKMEPGFGMVVCRLSTFGSTAFYWIGVRRWSRLGYFAANSDWICLASAGLG